MKEKKKLKIKGNKKYRESKERQQTPFHSFGFSDMISTWGQRHPKQDKRVNTERRHSEQGKQEKPNHRNSSWMRVGKLPGKKGPWKGERVTGAENRIQEKQQEKARLKLWMNMEMKGGRLMLLKKVKD